ncbi:hypothetical protein AAH991_36085 [Microbispora sp. ZYX-F-249]|uniref:GAF domain-containing protein n=1 Tax=Microbispora maris TaxID=3144104 RepID=A0ABV0B218_9ACTN
MPFFTVLPALFPDGRPVTPRWRPVVWAGLLVTVLAAVGRPWNLIAAAVIVVALAATASLVVRWIRSGPEARRQIAYLLYAAGYVVLIEIAGGLLPHHARQAAILLIPIAPTVAIALAVLRHRLYGIDLVIRRTFVYLTVTGLMFSGYLAAVALLGTALSRAVSPQAALVAAALRSPGVAVALLTDGLPEEIARSGDPEPEPVEVPLVAQGERLGTLVVGRRARCEPYGAKDLRLIAELGHHVAAALAAARLTAELDRARQQAIGISSMRRRVTSIGGRFAITADRGATVTAVFPLELP